MSRKRMRFDPLSMRTDFKKQKTLARKFSEAYAKFAESVSGVSEISFSIDDLHSTNSKFFRFIYLV